MSLVVVGLLFFLILHIGGNGIPSARNDIKDTTTMSHEQSDEDEPTTTTTATSSSCITAFVCGSMSSVPDVYFSVMTEERCVVIRPDLQEAMDERLFDSGYEVMEDCGGSEKEYSEEEEGDYEEGYYDDDDDLEPWDETCPNNEDDDGRERGLAGE